MSQNHLRYEKSPYLLQHKENPVWWYPWGEAAFAAASLQRKPVFLSIGYSTCYWCHVMEKDSFESEDLAAVLNEYFICIKVDREERPDVDQVYMDAVVGLTGHGGWPMSVFLMDDRKPFWGGTFFPKAQFLKTLSAIANAWSKEPQEVRDSAEHVFSVLSTRNDILPSADDEHTSVGRRAYDELLRSSVSELQQSFDPQYGGFGGAPKFPPSTQVSLLLRLSQRLANTEARNGALGIATVTLDHMARGGICDQLGGGFHRYSTDAQWLVPHFEKMLYDNALLSVAYLEAFQVTGNPFYARVARDTLSYLLRDMRSPEGGFFAAEDAGEVGKEGEFYVWDADEVREVLGGEGFARFCEVYPFPPGGNFEHGKTILTISRAIDWKATEEPAILSLKKDLLSARQARMRPHRDEKILAGWNGLAISAFARGYQVLRESAFLDAAVDAADLLLTRLALPEGLGRSFCDGEVRHAGCLDDYAYVIEGLLELYRASFEERWLREAVRLQAEQDEKLWDDARGFYRYSAATDLIFSKVEWYDGATPSPLATSLGNLIQLHAFGHEPLVQRRAEMLTTGQIGKAGQSPGAFSKFLHQVDILSRGVVEVKLSCSPGGSVNSEFVRDLHASLLPGVYVSHDAVTLTNNQSRNDQFKNGKEGSELRAMICKGNVCQPPVIADADVLTALRSVESL